jgi:FkbM family methyltransferase
MIPTAKTVVGRLLRLPLRWVPPLQPRRILVGPLAGLSWLPGSAPHGCWLGLYERDLQRTMAAIVRPGDVVFDVGANVGFFTLLASRLAGPGGRVVAIEPFARNLDFLRQHIALNQLANVVVVAQAVADQPGTGAFAPGRSPSMGRLDASGIPVAVTTLDALVASGTVPPPRVIKMDIEGAESRALSGARRTLADHRPIILLSTHGHAQDAACRAFLEELGYTVTLRRDGAADGQYELVAQPAGAR